MNNYDYVGIVNSINKDMNGLYPYKFPIFKDNNFKAMAGALLKAPQDVQNAYINKLRNFMFVSVIKKIYKANNPFRQLYRDPVNSQFALNSDGRVVEEVAIDQFMPIAYEMKGDASTFFEGAPPQLKVQYYCNLLRKKYQVTFNIDLLVPAFEQQGGVESFMTKAIERMYADMEEDDKEEIMAAINGVIEGGNMYLYPLTKPSDHNTALDFSTKLQTLTYDLGFDRSRDYNLQHVSTKTDPSEAVLILSGDVISVQSNWNLAWAFNQNYLDLLSAGKLIKLSSKGLCDKRVYGIYVDEDYFRIHDVQGFPKLKDWQNGENLEDKKWLHNWKMVNFSYASNAIAFVDPSDIGVASMTIADEDGNTSSTVKAGKFVQLAMPKVTAVEGKLADCFVEYTISGNTDDKTVISGDGTIYVGKDETAGTEIVITAKHHLDNSITAEYTITVA